MPCDGAQSNQMLRCLGVAVWSKLLTPNRPPQIAPQQKGSASNPATPHFKTSHWGSNPASTRGWVLAGFRPHWPDLRITVTGFDAAQIYLFFPHSLIRFGRL
jgi:hypothetical protein